MATRIKVFNEAFMQKFSQEHEEAFKDRKLPKFGYPDTGNGKFGKALPYADWYKMNNGQRAQINFLEQITFILGTGLISAFEPTCVWWAFGFLATFWVGRILFSIGYTSKGPGGRLAGAIIGDVAILGLIVLSIVVVSTM